MTKERRVTVRGIIYKDGKLFAQQLKSSDGVREYWCTPGGGLDPGESLTDGLHREMIEETGVAPRIGNLLYVQQYQDDEKEFLEFFFHIQNPDDYHMVDLAATSHGMIEIEHCEFVDPGAVTLLPAFLQTADIAGAIRGDQPVIVQSYL